ncbi:hypothetical protein MSS4_03396 [Mycobacterium marinum]|uniref:hypothetical protein n=1 Tax=Mycobacterium marinum TaxID=1781 RepID=UPI000E3C12C6|nr:hypothetical protein [Mycobacterium marinum]RFZ47398.1 hypothetical protein MSS4_03396 [Mycobacterium marinum]
MPFGQSPFAIGRGVGFESFLRRHGHAELRRVLTEGLGVDFSNAGIENLREGYQPNRTGLALRASVTRSRLAEIIANPDELVVLDGAVLRGDIGGLTAYFEADEMAIGVHGQIVPGEEKSWPIVDGRATDERALGAALDQAALYTLLGRQTLDRDGIDPGWLSGAAALINPRNTGLTAILHRQNVEPRVRRIERLLETVPRVADIASSVPATVTFDEVADQTLDAQQRIDAFVAVSDEVGRVYEPASCLSSCGLAGACRQCAFTAADPAIAGGHVAQALPGLVNLDRVAELSYGAPASVAEAAVAAPIARAGRLYDEVVPLPMPRVRRPA